MREIYKARHSVQKNGWRELSPSPLTLEFRVHEREKNVHFPSITSRLNSLSQGVVMATGLDGFKGGLNKFMEEEKLIQAQCLNGNLHVQEQSLSGNEILGGNRGHGLQCCLHTQLVWLLRNTWLVTDWTEMLD